MSSDSVESHRAFAEKHDLPFHLLSDVEGTVRELYDVPSFGPFGFPGRVTYVIDRNGQVIHMYDSMLRARKHIQEALTALERGNGS